MTQTSAQAWYAEGKVEGKLEGKLEGRAEQMQKIIQRWGTKRLGVVDAGIVSQLNAISDIDRLERMWDRLESASSWADLLATT